MGSISFQENQNLKTLINRRNVFRNKNKIQSREVLRCFLPIKCTHMLPEECYPLERKTRALKFSKLEVRHETSLTLKTHLPFFLEAAMGAGVRSRSAGFGVREREKKLMNFYRGVTFLCCSPFLTENTVIKTSTFNTELHRGRINLAIIRDIQVCWTSTL